MVEKIEQRGLPAPSFRWISPAIASYPIFLPWKVPECLVVNFFGGSAARDGVTSTVAVKGNRMMTTSGTTTGQIIDLGEEKVYELDLRKKTYTVAAFADLRRAMEEGRKKAEEEAKREQPAEAKKDPNAKEYEVRSEEPV